MTNTATIADQLLATTLDVSSVDLVVGDVSGPASGSKALYLDNILADPPTAAQPLTISRVPLSATSSPVNRLRIRRQDDSIIWTMAPASTGLLSLNNTAIPVRLLMRRNGSTNDRDIRVSVSYSGASTGFIGCADQTLSGTDPTGLSNTATREFVFNVPRTDANCAAISAAPLDLQPGTSIQLQVDNAPGSAATGQAIFVYPFDAGLGNSQLELPATTVINVDSLGFYDAAYPDGNLLSSVAPGATVFVRGLVTDPFGAFDITAAVLSITNSASVQVLSEDLEPASVVDSSAGSKTYERAFVVPGSGPTGTWVAALQADEGTEGTISHTRTSNIEIVAAPTITLVKNSLTASDPMGNANPKSIPGAVIQYSIAVHNQGPGDADADSIVVSDSLPAQSRLLFDTGTMDPIIFVNGPTPSGLSYTFTSLADVSDDITFSNDGGATEVTPLVDSITGLDQTVPRINHVRVNLKGTLVPSAAGPSFTLRMLIQID